MKQISLSFQVFAITERPIAGDVNGLTYYETTLRCYNGDGNIVIRGNPWSVGTKIDFTQIIKSGEPKN